MHFHYLGTKCGGDLGGAQGAAWCRGPEASASLTSRELRAWRDAHLGKGTCQPHLLAGWELLPVFLPRQAGRSPAPSCGQYCLTQLGVSCGSDSGGENGNFLGFERLLLLPLLLGPWDSPGSWCGPSRKLLWLMVSDLTTANTVCSL